MSSKPRFHLYTILELVNECIPRLEQLHRRRKNGQSKYAFRQNTVKFDCKAAVKKNYLAKISSNNGLRNVFCTQRKKTPIVLYFWDNIKSYPSNRNSLYILQSFSFRTVVFDSTDALTPDFLGVVFDHFFSKRGF